MMATLDLHGNLHVQEQMNIISKRKMMDPCKA